MQPANAWMPTNRDPNNVVPNRFKRVVDGIPFNPTIFRTNTLSKQLVLSLRSVGQTFMLTNVLDIDLNHLIAIKDKFVMVLSDNTKMTTTPLAQALSLVFVVVIAQGNLAGDQVVVGGQHYSLPSFSLKIMSSYIIEFQPDNSQASRPFAVGPDGLLFSNGQNFPLPQVTARVEPARRGRKKAKASMTPTFGEMYDSVAQANITGSPSHSDNEMGHEVQGEE